jgi:hypothetical protein
VDFLVTFSEAVAGFDSFADIQVNATGTAAAGAISVASGSGLGPYTVRLSAITGDGTLGIGAKVAACADAAGNPNPASSPSATFTVDNTPPTISLIGAPSAALTNSGPVDYSVTFSEAVTGFDSPSDIQVNATGTAAAGAVAVVVGSGAGPHAVRLSSITGEGTLGITIKAAACADPAGNPNPASSPGEGFGVDNTPPAVPEWLRLSPEDDTGVSSSDGITTKSAGLRITGTADLDSTVTIYAGSNALTTGTAAAFNSQGLTVSLSEGLTTLTARARDAAGNVSAASAALFVTVDATKPAVTVNRAAGQTDPTTSLPVCFVALFSEPVSGFGNSSATVSGTAGGTKTVSVTSADLRGYGIAVGGITSAGTVTVSVAAGRCTDEAGNANTASTSTNDTVRYNVRPAAAESWMLFE